MTMELIRGFTWPVPLAFASAVAACRFEQGDVLYSDVSGYETWTSGWSAAGQAPGHCVQVLGPARSTRLVSGEDSGKRFFGNWESPVEIELARGLGGAPELRSTSQGRLFSCLWRGDLGLLDEGAPAPEPPSLQRDLHARLEEALPALRSRLAASSASGPHSLYVSAVDQASESSRTKAHAIEAVLAERFEVTRCDVSPAEADLDGADRFHPALTLRGLWIAGAMPDRVEKVLKGLLYSAAEGKADRFSISRHGTLVAGEEGLAQPRS